ncbi:MAG: type II secretion system F family protein [Candidatus Thiodiazotropha lotti]|nr:type II secretion system F family protein [Candidatus Thiodiazotropha lotti]MCG7998524.1 type II secretion system F family protein [Candidatus Thiodiazotropha lotti]MCW4183678.1 type II secretion system F family protein [Candidatus Thiodiazotropha weberae]MCW4190290.1 type II secretion system F family protein [Candidatus Thiodiazotropha weberae]
MAPPRKKPKIKSYLFTWEGTDKKGSRLSGEARATDANMVKADLRRQGVTPIKVRKKPVSIFSKKKKITSADVTVFSRQLATMMSAGVPMVQAFDIVGRGHENPSMQELVLTIKADVEGGTALADALKKHPLHFEDLFVNLVRAGEHAGVLETLLHKIATYKEKTESIKAKIKKALFYPAAIVAAAIIVTAILLIFVIPQFEALFSNFGAELPAFTQMVVSMSHFVRDKWWIILGISFIAVYLFICLSVYLFINTWKRSRKLRHTIDRILLKVPVIGMILNKSAIARFSRTLATMSAAGVPLVEALDSVAGATGNVVYSDAVMRMREDVATGQSLQLAMKQRNLFPNMVVQMVSIGEESGSLDDMLNKVADFYEEQVDNAVDAMSSLMEPLIMVVLGTLVGGLVIAMYLPIFKMGTAI